jgi:methylglyoxal synthase
VLIAHDNKKADMLEWARFNRDTLSRHDLLGTGTTGAMVANELGLPVHRFLTGPLGGELLSDMVRWCPASPGRSPTSD